MACSVGRRIGREIDDLAVAPWERVQRIYLVDDPREARTSVLSEPGVEC